MISKVADTWIIKWKVYDIFLNIGQLFYNILKKCCLLINIGNIRIYKCYIVGEIPSLLLSLWCIQEDVNSILQHICTRLTSTSITMVSDPIYICHCYDIMAYLFSSYNDTRLVINRGLTVSEDKHGNLGMWGSVYSYLLGSLKSKHMAKNICT